MRQSVTYFVAAGLFALATALHIFSQGLTLMTAIGFVLGGILVHLGLSSRRAGD